MLEHIPVGFMGKVDEKLSRKRKNVLFAQKGQKAKGFWRFEHILCLFCFLKSLRRTPALLLLSFLAIRKVSHIIQILIFYVQKAKRWYGPYPNPGAPILWK